MTTPSSSTSWPLLAVPIAAVRTCCRSLAARLRRRTDSEAEQAIVRVVLGAAACAYMLSADLGDAHTVAQQVIAWDAVIFVIGAVVLLITVLLSEKTSWIRRSLGIVLDMTATSLAVAFGGEAAAPLLAVYLWVIVGNGFRYGHRYLIFAVTMALVGFSAAILYSPFWRQHVPFSASFLLALILIPAYMEALLRKLRFAMKQADEANQAKSRFLAKMSHELRTPLNGVIGVADLLDTGTLDARERNLVATIRASSGVLLDLIDDILDFSRIESGHVEIARERFRIDHFVEETLAMLRPQAEKKGLKLTHHVDPRIPRVLIGDPAHTRQILLNLVSNAIKFTDSGNVRVTVNLGKHNDDTKDQIRYEVCDTGCGIAPHDQARIFESFQQVSAGHDRGAGGIGLGTAIARELAQRMQGEIGVRSELGQGSMFWFELPFEVPEPSDLDGAAELLDARVLVAGSSEAMVSSLMRLDRFGLRVVRASSPMDAAEQLARAAMTGKAYSLLLVYERDFDTISLEAFGRVGKVIDRFLIRANSAHEAITPSGFKGVLHWPLELDDIVGALRDCDQGPRSRQDNVISFAEYYRSIASQRNTQLRILIAEDNETNRRVVEEILAQAGHQLTLVADGEAALDALTRNDFDLMLLDKNMPNHSGLEVFKAQRFMQPSSPIPTIILSADATEEAERACLGAGIDAFLTKPVATYKLLEAVARVSRNLAETPLRNTSASPRTNDAKSSRSPLLDHERLRCLREVSAGSDEAEFLEGLLADFRRDSMRAVAATTDALSRQDYPALRAALHALEGGSQELGALGILHSINQLKNLRPFELDSSRAKQGLAQLREAVSATSRLLSTAIIAAGEDVAH
jgi:two-component system sensor histidine kinase RpfC